MECNKEEAFRAKQLAENKMENKDFVGARKVALKAQQLYPDLDNISQLITVCDVHCSAENKAYGNEKDWYGILQIESSADESLIKKQYRKLALLLHPDKNKFAGSADAFKLIGEAQRVLADREKRMLHDMKRKASGRSVAPSWAPQQSSRHSNVGQQRWTPNNFTSGQYPNSQVPPQWTQTGLNENQQTFWTQCPFCHVRYQFYKEVINKILLCQSCKKSFSGHEINVQGAAPGLNRMSSVTQQSQAPFNGPHGTSQNSASKAGFHRSSGSENMRHPFTMAGSNSEAGQQSRVQERYANTNMKTARACESKERKSHGKVNGKRRKQLEESSASCDSESSTDSEEDIFVGKDSEHPAGQGFQYYGEQPRRSSRSKRNVSYTENLSDDENVSPSKRPKSSESSRATKQEVEDPSLKVVHKMDVKPPDLAGEMKVDEKELKHEECYEVNSENLLGETKEADEKEGLTMDGEIRHGETASITYEFPDPEFSDFDKDRKEELFKVGQIWAVYDTQDAMPRFHVWIRKVFSPGFKLGIYWLEPDPDDEDEINWVNQDLPVSCGKFKRGIYAFIEQPLMFSHLVQHWEKGGRRDTYKIYPRKGETWALFKNWNMKWSSFNCDGQKKFEYELVEILADYDNSVGVRAAYLSKVKGFTCLFSKTSENGMILFVLVPPNEKFRFSHKVPSVQMTGEEREGVPRGSFELDPASNPNSSAISSRGDEQEVGDPLPKEEVHKMEEPPGPAADMKVDKKELKHDKRYEENPQNGERENETENEKENLTVDGKVSCEKTAPAFYECPDPEFSDFDKDRTEASFADGQIWAVYDTQDAMPRYYARIRKVLFPAPNFRLQITWLEPDLDDEDEIKWANEGLPVSCGNFRRGRNDKAEDLPMFSHLVHWEEGSGKHTFKVYPRKGETWALFKNWDIKWYSTKPDGKRKYEYEFVEILTDYNDNIGVCVAYLSKVKGFICIFCRTIDDERLSSELIPPKHKFRFSHRVPSARMTGQERQGVPIGSFELDPASLPINL